MEPNSPTDLARGLRSLIESPDQRTDRGQKGRAAVESDFNTQVMAQRTETVYQAVVAAARESNQRGAEA